MRCPVVDLFARLDAVLDLGLPGAVRREPHDRYKDQGPDDDYQDDRPVIELLLSLMLYVTLATASRSTAERQILALCFEPPPIGVRLTSVSTHSVSPTPESFTLAKLFRVLHDPFQADQAMAWIWVPGGAHDLRRLRSDPVSDDCRTR